MNELGCGIFRWILCFTLVVFSTAFNVEASVLVGSKSEPVSMQRPRCIVVSNEPMQNQGAAHSANKTLIVGTPLDFHPQCFRQPSSSLDNFVTSYGHQIRSGAGISGHHKPVRRSQFCCGSPKHGGRLPIVYNCVDQVGGLIAITSPQRVFVYDLYEKIGPFESEIGPFGKISLSLSFPRGLDGSDSSPLSFLDHIPCGFSGGASVEQSSPNQKDTHTRKADTREGRPKHELGPFSHALLSVKIAASALLFCGGLLLIYLGFQRAGNASELVLDGLKSGWIGVGFWLSLSLGGAFLSSGVAVYWLSACGYC